MAKKKKSKLKWVIISFILVSALSFTYFKFFVKQDTSILVSTSKVERRTIIQRVTAVGNIKPETEVKISSETSGELIFLGVKEGDTISQGQILARVKPDIIETQLKQQEAALDAAKMDIEFQKANVEQTKAIFMRIKELYGKEFASKQDFENAKADYDKSQSQYQSALARFEQSLASLNQIKRSADRTTIYSPINGVVTSLLVELGEKILGTAQFQGTEIMKVADLNIMNALVEVDENDIVLIEKGDTARIEIDAFPNKIFNGYVIEIGHSAIVSNTGGQDQVTNFQVKIRLLDYDSKIRPGMSCGVKIETDIRENVLAVPLQAVTVRTNLQANKEMRGGLRKRDESQKASGFGGKPKPVVFKRDGNVALLSPVEVGISDNGFIEILEGLKEGQEIISGNYTAVSKELNDSSLIKMENDEGGKGGWKGKRRERPDGRTGGEGKSREGQRGKR
jgi:HlyD family secretion protein